MKFHVKITKKYAILVVCAVLAGAGWWLMPLGEKDAKFRTEPATAAR